MKYLAFDFETKSECDLKKHGTWQYSCHPTTEILCMAYGFSDSDKTNLWLPGDPIPDEFGVQTNYVAHNALFEYAHMKNILVPEFAFPPHILDYKLWHDTAAMGRCLGLSGHLGELGHALNLRNKKFVDLGKKLINKISKPSRRKGGIQWAKVSNDELHDMYRYCIQDVEATKEIFNRLHSQTNITLERDIWLLDFKQNISGLPIDTRSLEQMNAQLDSATEKIREKAYKQFGFNLQSHPQFLAKLKSLGLPIEDLQRQTLEYHLEITKSPEVKELLSFRLFLSQASIKKYRALLDRVSINTLGQNTIKGCFRYFGAHTGRWSGQGFQPHNLPKMRTSEKEITALLLAFDNDSIPNKDLIHSAKKVLPGMVKADPEHIFILGDFASIEARVLALLAGQHNLLEVFRQGGDAYKLMAGQIFNLPIPSVTEEQRHLGKQAVLGCGYGMGARKFQSTCKDAGLDVSLDLAELAVDTYRTSNHAIRNFWAFVDRAFKKSLENRHTQQKFQLPYLTFQANASCVTIELPSSRKFYYHKPKYVDEDLTFFHAKKKRCKLYGGLLTENIVQAVARDILVNCMVELDKNNLNPILHVHDEIVCHVPKKGVSESIEIFEKITNTPPVWLNGLPLKTTSEVSHRYHK